EYPGRKEVRQRRLDVAEPQHVRDVARALDREDEVVRHVGIPRGIARRSLQRVEAAVQLDRREPFRRVSELPLLGVSLRIELASPSGIAPSRDADAYRH